MHIVVILIVDKNNSMSYKSTATLATCVVAKVPILKGHRHGFFLCAFYSKFRKRMQNYIEKKKKKNEYF